MHKQVFIATLLVANAVSMIVPAAARDTGLFGDWRAACAQSMRSFPSALHGRQPPLYVARPGTSLYWDKRSGGPELFGRGYFPRGECNQFGR